MIHFGIIEYNLLNLPHKIMRNDTMATYKYLADGTKLSATAVSIIPSSQLGGRPTIVQNGFDYLGSLVYKRESNIVTGMESTSFGWTKKIVSPVWLFFGPGYTGIGECIKENSETETETENTDKVKMNIKHAISPEAGVLLRFNLGNKIGLVLRYTFQYRFA